MVHRSPLWGNHSYHSFQTSIEERQLMVVNLVTDNRHFGDHRALAEVRNCDLNLCTT